MTKLATTTKKTPAYPPRRQPTYDRAHHVARQGSGQPVDEETWEETVDTAGSFFSLSRKVCGFTKKDLIFELRWSKTYIDGILSGKKNDFLEQTRKYLAMMRKRKRMDMVAATLVHVAGGDDFDGRVLTAEQNQKLKDAAEVLKGLAMAVQKS